MENMEIKEERDDALQFVFEGCIVRINQNEIKIMRDLLRRRPVVKLKRLSPHQISHYVSRQFRIIRYHLRDIERPKIPPSGKVKCWDLGSDSNYDTYMYTDIEMISVYFITEKIDIHKYKIDVCKPLHHVLNCFCLKLRHRYECNGHQFTCNKKPLNPSLTPKELGLKDRDLIIENLCFQISDTSEDVLKSIFFCSACTRKLDSTFDFTNDPPHGIESTCHKKYTSNSSERVQNLSLKVDQLGYERQPTYVNYSVTTPMTATGNSNSKDKDTNKHLNVSRSLHVNNRPTTLTVISDSESEESDANEQSNVSKSTKYKYTPLFYVHTSNNENQTNNTDKMILYIGKSTRDKLRFEVDMSQKFVYVADAYFTMKKMSLHDYIPRFFQNGIQLDMNKTVRELKLDDCEMIFDHCTNKSSTLASLTCMQKDEGLNEFIATVNACKLWQEENSIFKEKQSRYEKNMIHLYIGKRNGKKFKYKVMVRFKLQHTMQAYLDHLQRTDACRNEMCGRKCFCKNNFIWNGAILNSRETPKELGMQDSDVIFHERIEYEVEPRFKKRMQSESGTNSKLVLYSCKKGKKGGPKCNYSKKQDKSLPEQDEPESVISIYVSKTDGTVIRFQMKTGLKLSHLVKAYYAHLSKTQPFQPQQQHFTWKGQKLNISKTPKELKMKNAEVIFHTDKSSSTARSSHTTSDIKVEENQHIDIFLGNMIGTPIEISINVDFALHQIFCSYFPHLSKAQLLEGKHNFMWNGQKLDTTRTPKMLGMQEGDIILDISSNNEEDSSVPASEVDSKLSLQLKEASGRASDFQPFQSPTSSHSSVDFSRPMLPPNTTTPFRLAGHNRKDSYDPLTNQPSEEIGSYTTSDLLSPLPISSLSDMDNDSQENQFTGEVLSIGHEKQKVKEETVSNFAFEHEQRNMVSEVSIKRETEEENLCSNQASTSTKSVFDFIKKEPIDPGYGLQA